MEKLAHRIHGSGAMFGFDAMSERARRIEMIVGKKAVRPAQIGGFEQR